MQCEAIKFSNKKGRIRCPSCNGLNPLDLPINKTSGKSFNCFSCGTLLYAFKFKSNLLIIPHRGWVSRSRRGFLGVPNSSSSGQTGTSSTPTVFAHSFNELSLRDDEFHLTGLPKTQPLTSTFITTFLTSKAIGKKSFHSRSMAERVGFEPTVGCPTHAFQACALSHSATSL